MLLIDSPVRDDFMSDSTSVVDCIREREKERKRPINAQY